MSGAGHRVVIDVIWCGGCGHAMELTEHGTYRCVNGKCEIALTEFSPRIFMDTVVGTPTSIPGVGL